MSDITVQGIRIRVKDEGYGKPILFIHGHPDSADLWNAVIQYLPKEGYRYIRPDLPGYGESGDGKGFDLSIENRGQWVADVLAAVGVSEPVTIVGHDHGGVFAASFAVQYEAQVSKLILMNTLFHADTTWHLFAILWRTPFIGENMAFWQRYRLTLPLLKWYMRRGEPSLTNDYLSDLQKTFSRTMGQQMHRLYRAIDPELFEGWEDKFHAFIGRKATLVLWGAEDKYLPIKFAERMASHGAQLAIFTDAGHWLMVTKAEEVAHKIIHFLHEIE
ncbi:MAG: alpha/beta hydrolase [Anaerolineae bacterium]|nr:alpha/beta hydrolase [Anaerolineae bacterium]